MTTYVILSNLTDEGAKTLKTHPERVKEVNREFEALGVKVLSQYALLGPYDFLSIVDGPDNRQMARVAAELASRGSLKVLTMAAIPIDEFVTSFS